MQDRVDCANIMLLDGLWEAGIERRYEQVVCVPGLVTDPAQKTAGTLWYRRQIVLPAGTWKHATLILNGARFCPSVYVNTEFVGTRPGGMTVTTFLLDSQAVQPGNTILLEIALKSLADLASTDASYIPVADHWRSNISSCLWDHVRLRMHGAQRIDRVMPNFALARDQLAVAWSIAAYSQANKHLLITCQIIDEAGHLLVESSTAVAEARGVTQLALREACTLWSPERPVCYRLRVQLRNGPEMIDQDEMTLGLKEFCTQGLCFQLNSAPVRLRAGTVAWPRWLRDAEARELAFDRDWFERNVVVRLKQHGANALRFHLGTPPEDLLDLCDRHGLLVQIEWHFFHGMTASVESLLEQWRNWLDMCVRHPSICLIHPWNETEGEQLERARSVLEQLTVDYPALVISHRDVLHIHKYWWSLFENLGLYYDSAEQFPLPIMVDEFGGNYLDGEGNPGGYPALAESFLRFLGREHTAALRLQLNCEANTQIAEYWRRLGAAGFSPFCILGSPQDGNHHFLGALRDGIPKPVWAGLTAAYAPLSCSLEVWDRNYLPDQMVTLPVYFFNDSMQAEQLVVQVSIVAEEAPEHIVTMQTSEHYVQANTMVMHNITLQLPHNSGQWRFQAQLQQPVQAIMHPVISSWRFHIHAPHVPEQYPETDQRNEEKWVLPLMFAGKKNRITKGPNGLSAIVLGIADDEPELQAFARENALSVCAFEDTRADIRLLSASSWQRLMVEGTGRQWLEQALEGRQSILMLDIGPQRLGYGYVPGNSGFLQGTIQVQKPEMQELDLVFGARLRFREVAEPESCLHPGPQTETLWQGLDRQQTWLWNGLRGGLIVPATEMELLGVDAASFLALWQTYGADAALIKNETDYCAYQLAGFYAFSCSEDEQVAKQLRAKVVQMVEDAPALQATIDPRETMQVHHLSALYRRQRQPAVQRASLTVLATCGKNLARNAVIQLDFGAAGGRLLLSQVITRGRLAQRYGTKGLYGVRYDPVAVHFTLNMLKTCSQNLSLRYRSSG